MYIFFFGKFQSITKYFQIEFVKMVLDLNLFGVAIYTYHEYIMRNTGLKEAQAGIKIAGRNINNLRYADVAESEEELKSLLMTVKEEREKLA